MLKAFYESFDSVLVEVRGRRSNVLEKQAVVQGEILNQRQRNRSKIKGYKTKMEEESL